MLFGFALATVAASVAAPADDIAAALGAMTVAPSSGRRDLYVALINGLKADGLWDHLDWLLILAAHDEQAGRVNLRRPHKLATLAGTVAFTADRGFTGDGATGYLNLGEAHGAAGQFAWRDSCSAGAWCNLAGGTAGLIAHLGQATGTYRTSIFAHSAGNDSFRLADSTGDTLRAGTSRTGHRSIARSGPTTKLGFYAGAQVAAVTTASTGLSSLPMVGLRSNTSFAPDRLAALWSGDGAIVGAKAAAIHDRLNTFLTAIGAA